MLFTSKVYVIILSVLNSETHTIMFFFMFSIFFTSLVLKKIGDKNQILAQKVDFTSPFMNFLGKKNTISGFNRNVRVYDRKNWDLERNF